METILSKIFDINYHLPWSDDKRLEETSAYLKLKEATKALIADTNDPLRHETFNCALDLISLEVLRNDEFTIGGLARVSEELRRNIEDLKWEEICALSNYFNLYKSLQFNDAEEFYFLTSDAQERVNYETVVSQVVLCLTMEVEIAEARLHGFLKYALPKEFWYDVYNAEDDYNKERVGRIIGSLFRRN
jgi:hypothetical protein